MKLYNVNGKLVNKNLNKYLINWDGKSRSKIQFEAKQFLKPFWNGYIVYEESPVYGTLLKVDILNASLRIAIEVNGPQHGNLHYFHNKQPLNYLKGFKNDAAKEKWLKLNNFQLCIINHDEIKDLSKEFFRDKFNIIL